MMDSGCQWSSGSQSTARKVHQGQIFSHGLPLWNVETVWKEMQRASQRSMLQILRVSTKSLPIWIVLGKQEEEDFRSSAAVTACLGSSLSVLKAPLFVVPFSGSQTSSYTTGGQMYFWWSQDCLSTIPGGHQISTAKNVTRGKEGSVEQNQVFVFIFWKPFPSSIYMGAESLLCQRKWSRLRITRAEEPSIPYLTALLDPHFATHTRSDRIKVQNELVQWFSRRGNTITSSQRHSEIFGRGVVLGS